MASVKKKKKLLSDVAREIREGRLMCGNNPIEWFLEISNLCNIRCLTCGRLYDERFKDPSFSGNMKPDIMETVDPLLDNSLTVHSVGFGEPFVNRHAIEYIRAIKKHDTFLDVITNGTLLKGKEVALMNSKLDQIIVSIDGGTPETFEQFRCGAKWDDVVKSLKTLHEKKRKAKKGCPNVCVEFVAMNGNIDSLPKLVELCASEWGAQGITVEALLQTVCEGYSDFYDEQNLSNRPYEEVDALFNEAKAVADKHGLFIEGPYYGGNRKKIWENAHSPSILQPWDRKIRFRPYCTLPWTTTFVAFDGTVRPCCFSESATVLGDVTNQSFEEVWNGEEYQQLRHDILNDLVPETCKLCVANARIHGRAIFDKFGHYLI